MGKIEKIKERLNKFKTAPREGVDKGLPFDTIRVIGDFSDNAPADIEFLLSRLEIAEEEKKKLREALDKAHVLLDKYETML